jgi:hypothetical protein
VPRSGKNFMHLDAFYRRGKACPLKRLQGMLRVVSVVVGALGGSISAMAIDQVTIDRDEDESMLIRRALRQETISGDIAIQIAKMVFVRLYGEEYAEERSPLAVIDRGDRWEIHSREGIEPGERLKMVIRKTNGQILQLVNW